MVEYLGSKRRRRTCIRQRYASGSRQIGIDPVISEWGNLHSMKECETLWVSKVAHEQTQGTETSKYLQEKKSIEIPQ
jgi:hypothetical protein